MKLLSLLPPFQGLKSIFYNETQLKQIKRAAAPLVWLDIVKNEILQESQKTNSARNWPISPFFSPASHFFMLKGPNSIFKFMKGQPYILQSLQEGQKLTEYNLFMDRRMHSHTITLFVW